MTDEKPNPFNIIKHAGEPNKADFEGVTVTRQEKLDAGEWGLISCTPYDNHFIFKVPDSRLRPGMWEHWCTCGSMASIVPPFGNSSMWTCNFYHGRFLETGHGYHQTTVINKDDFENIAGKTIELPKGKKWLI
jgi:hypothetical protein